MPRNAAKKARKTRQVADTVETEVIALLPLTVDLAKINSRNDLRFEVKSGGVPLGTLQIGRGSVRWYKPKARKPTREWTWKAFVKLLIGEQ